MAVEQKYEDRRASYAKTFGTPDGKAVLRELIEDCHVFETIAPGDIEALALRNYALSVMVLSGILEETEDNDPVARIMNMVH